jgi:glucosamine--fructose-6-phosphate aminotransferase (isomerizing)
MCGIVGYIGPKQAKPILLDGLRKLEYRGYDSAGIAVWDRNQIVMNKTKGRVADLASVVRDTPMEGTLGIAHTRWATHGEPSAANAHPHTDEEGNVYVVHNGIVENYKPLKQKLEEFGHRFKSKTDTEVITHLIQHFMAQGADLEHAVKHALRRIQGTYAILAIASKEPDKIIAARMASPLRIGVTDGQIIIASDPAAILSHTTQVITLSDGEVANIDRNGYTITSTTDDEIIDKNVDDIEWDVSEIEKSGFEHFMLKEIFEQPEAIKNSVRGRLIPESGLAVLGGLESVEQRLRQVKRIHIVACGTAFHAGLVGEYMLEEYAGIPVEVCIGSEFRYRKAVLDPKDDAVLVISQSGETADSLAAVREAKEKGVLTLGIVNVVGSTIAQETDAGVYTHAGPEIGVASTKVFVSQLAVLALFIIFLGRQRQMSVVVGKRIAEALLAIPKQVQSILEQDSVTKLIAQKYFKSKDVFFLGRKYNFPIALEGALKLKEISYIHAEGYASGELKHGPLAVIDELVPSVVVCPQDSVYEKNISNIEEIRARHGKIVAIATHGDEEIKQVADDVIYIPKTLEMLTPILSAIPLQLLSYHVALALGHDIDKPRNIAKTATVE